MRGKTAASPPHNPSYENALRVVVVAALAATTMLFASLTSAYLVRRSFADWRPTSAAWPFALLAFAVWASAGIEAAGRSEGTIRRRGLWHFAAASSLYLLAAIMVIGSIFSGEDGLAAPHQAFIAVLLGVHLFHALFGTAFAAWILNNTRPGDGDRPQSSEIQRREASAEHRVLLARVVVHFLSGLLFAILFLLFVLQ